MRRDREKSRQQAATALLNADTAPEVQDIQVELWRKMSPLEKARAVRQVSRSVRELSLAGIRQRYPTASERECLLRYAQLTLGPRLAARAYPEADKLSGR